MNWICSFVAGLVFLLVSGYSHSQYSLTFPVSMDRLVEMSDSIVVGEVVDRYVDERTIWFNRAGGYHQWNGIYTIHTIKVDEVLKSSGRMEGYVKVHMTGFERDPNPGKNSVRIQGRDAYDVNIGERICIFVHKVNESVNFAVKGEQGVYNVLARGDAEYLEARIQAQRHMLVNAGTNADSSSHGNGMLSLSELREMIRDME